MANLLRKSLIQCSDSLPPFSGNPNTNTSLAGICLSSAVGQSLNLRAQRLRRRYDCPARRRVRFEDEGEDEDYGHNEQVARLESYTQAAVGEALIVHAAVGGENVEVLIFKVISSSICFCGYF